MLLTMRRHREAFATEELGSEVALLALFVDFRILKDEMNNAQGMVTAVGALSQLVRPAPEKVIELEAGARPVVGEPGHRAGKAGAMILVGVRLRRISSGLVVGATRLTMRSSKASGHVSALNIVTRRRGSRAAQAAGNKTQVPRCSWLTPH